MELLQRIADLLIDHTSPEASRLPAEMPLLRRIAEKICREEPLTFILPAFPAKSPSPEKTSGPLPDLGEVLALQNLNTLCEKISSFYYPGAQVIICSDGRVFSDIVRVGDEHVDMYQQGIEEIIEEFKLSHLATFSLDDLYPDWSGDALREWLLVSYARTSEEVIERVRTREDQARLFNGLHRFLTEDDRALYPEKSRSEISRKAKERTIELMRRSDAWSALLEKHFPDELRLSIHPYPIGHEKFGVRLLPSALRWATPWHNVTVKLHDRFELMHLSEALKAGAIRKTLKEKYAYFEVANA